LLTNRQGRERLEQIRAEVPDLACVISVDEGFTELLAKASSEFTPVDTAAEEPAMMIYTSGTTGQPKGALHAQRVVPGHFPSIEFSHDFYPQAGDVMWTPADWAWAGGLFNAMLPALRYGTPLVSYSFGKYDPERAFALMEEFGIRNAFMPPTALLPHSCASMPRASPPEPTVRWRMSSRPRGDGADRSMRNAVGGMNALRTPALAISANASSGSNLSNLRATTGTPKCKLGSRQSSRPPAQAQSAGVQNRSPGCGKKSCGNSIPGR
jgi:acyl-CoA synthetase (AMP-forming)/AMP-acid ligase II